MKVLNFGSLNYDYVYQVDHMVIPGETQSASEMTLYYGGKGLNQSVSMSRAGLKVYHAGMIGEDGEKLLDACRANDIDTRYLEPCKGSNGHAIIQVNTAGENSIILYEGSNGANTKEHIDKVLESFGKEDLLLVQNEVNLLEVLIDRAYDRGMKIALNPSPFNEKIIKCHLNKVGIFIMNEIEGAQMTGEQEPEQILNQMQRMYPDCEVVLTLGKSGCMYHGRGRRIFCKSFPVDAIDTTGAGDTFTGYFLAGYLSGASMEDSLCSASAAAAISVTRPGASVSIPKLEEVMQFLQHA